MRRLPNGCTPPTGVVLDHDGRCTMSDLPPAQCGLRCHRNSADLPFVEPLFDDGHRL